VNTIKYNSLKPTLSRATKTLGIVLAISAALISNVEAREMRVSSFEPAQGFYSSKVLSVWIEKMNAKLSAGSRLRLYPGSILGAPPAQQELVKKGVADIALVVPTYTPGLFPLTSVVEVPGIAPTSADGTNVLNTLFEEGDLNAEFADYKVIALFTTHGYHVFLKDKVVTQPSDLAGLKLRTPSPFASKLLSMLGSSGVSIPAPQVYENLDRGVVDGVLWVFGAYKTFRLDEVVPKITMTNLTASPLAILMNKSTYNSLSEADRKVIDEMSGRATSEWIAGVVDNYELEQEKAFRADSKIKFTDLSVGQDDQWMNALKGAYTAWLDEQKGFDIDGTAVLEKAKNIRTGH